MDTEQAHHLPASDRISSTGDTNAAHTNGTPRPNGNLSDAEYVSPELIAAITDRVKKELVEHLKQTGSIDDRTKIPSLQRVPSNKSSSTSSPPPPIRRVYTPPSPPSVPKQTSFALSADPVRSPPSSPVEKPRHSERAPSRPFQTSRTYSTMELSTVDQKWGRLFDSEGIPTQRLGQFLRGLANHIVDDFMPKKSIVITPSKMAAFYATHHLDHDKEVYPYVSIFSAHPEEIALLYQRLGCQHHLVQESSTTPPTIPGLTPVGFAHWMTIQILAYPTEESSRFEKVVLAMPIDADGQMVDGKPERLPKQISRHLLPEKEDRKSRKLFDNAILDFLDELASEKRRKPKTGPSANAEPVSTYPQHTQSEKPTPRRSPPMQPAKPIERKRMPYTGVPDPSSADEPVKHELLNLKRDRQPYSAQPGNGRVYHNDNSSLDAPPSLGRASSTSRARSPHSLSRMRSPSYTQRMRSSSTTNRPPSPSEPRKRGQTNADQSSASQNYPPPPRAAARRERSPPPNGYSFSTPVIHNSMPVHGSVPKAAYPKSTPSTSQASQPSSQPPYSGPTFPPPPRYERDRDREMDKDWEREVTMPRDIPLRDKHVTHAGHRRPTIDGFQSPRDAERWDRMQEEMGSEYTPKSEYAASSGRGSDRRASVSTTHDGEHYERDRDRDIRDRDIRDRDRARGIYGYDR